MSTRPKVILWPYPWLSSLSRDGLPRLDPTVVFLVRLIARNARFWVPCTLWIKFVLNINNLSAISCQKLNWNCGLLNMKINSNTIINRLGSWKNQLLSEKEYIKLSFFFYIYIDKGIISLIFRFEICLKRLKGKTRIYNTLLIYVQRLHTPHIKTTMWRLTIHYIFECHNWCLYCF